MYLYHYSVDSYKGDKGTSLINDYKQQYKFAEPYILALNKSRDVFMAMYFATMYFSREIRELNLRKYENYQKDAVEGIFEHVRLTNYFENSVSRVKCVYYCESKDEAINYLKADCLDSGLFNKEQVCLLKVKVDKSRVFKYDQEYYNIAIEKIKNNDIDAVFECAHKYFNMERTTHPNIEILCDSENEIVEKIEF